MGKERLTLGSLFDGIGGWLASAVDCGIKPLWSSEIEKFPLAVTHRRFPEVEQVGDIKKLNGRTLKPVDIICMGSPCQGLSLAGKRRGLEDDRSGLFREATRITHEMRQATDGKYPRFVVWENVPGAFSSNKGMDFRAVLEEIGQTEIPMPPNGKWANAGMAELPQCEIAWRVLDAQYWGVPQRRRRIFLVADFAADGRCAGKILFEREGMSGDITESGEERQRTAEGTERSLGATGCYGECYNICSYASNSMKSDNPHSGIYRADKTRTLDLNGGNPACNQGGTMVVTAGFKAGQSANAGLGYAIETASCLASQCSGVEPTIACYDIQHRQDVIRPVEKAMPTLTARMGTGGNNVPIVQGEYIPYTANTLTACIDGSPCVDRGPQVIAVQGSMIGRSEKNGPQGSGLSDVCFTLNTVDRHAVATTHCMTTGSFMQIEKEKSPTLMARDFKDPNAIYSKTSFVRRLTPTECERLQGLPDGYTLIEDKSCSDSARYKALGNGMAKPCSDYVLHRLAEVVERE